MLNLPGISTPKAIKLKTLGEAFYLISKKHYKVSKEQILSGSRKGEVVELRRLFSNIAREETKGKVVDIAKICGIGHCDVVYHTKTYKNLLETDKTYKSTVIRFRTLLLSNCKTDVLQIRLFELKKVRKEIDIEIEKLHYLLTPNIN